MKWGGYQVNFTELTKGENLSLLYNVDSVHCLKVGKNQGICHDINFIKLHQMLRDSIHIQIVCLYIRITCLVVQI